MGVGSNPDLGLSDVYSRVLVGLLARQPIEADLFPGILEGLAGNLGLSPAGTVDPPRSRQEGVMRRWATTLRQAAYDPSDTGQGSASSTTPLGLHLDYSMEFRSRRVGDIPPALTSSLLSSFPFWRSPRPGNLRHLLQLHSQRKLTVCSLHYLTKRVRWISNLTNKRCWCNSPSRRRRWSVCGGLLARNPQAGSASLLTRRTIVSSLYPTTGQIPMVLVPPLGGRYPPRSRNGVGRANHPDAPPTKKPADDDETAPQPDQSPPAKTAEAILIATRNELYGKDNPPVQEVRARLLGLDPDVTPTDAQINASPRFALRSAAAERDAPDIITDHWMPYLEENGRLADCSPRSSTPLKAGCPYTPRRS